MANNIRVATGRSMTVMASAARTATPDTEEFETSGRSCTLVFDSTAVTSTPSTVVKVEGIDRLSGKAWTLLAGVAVATVTTQVLQIGPGLPATANASANAPLPPVIRVTATHGNANSHTYSIGVHFS